MALIFIAAMFVAHAAALLIDCLLLFLLVRVVAARWPAVVLGEVNEAARPLVDRALAGIDQMWNLIRLNSRLGRQNRIPAAALVLSVVRLSLAALTGLVAAIG